VLETKENIRGSTLKNKLYDLKLKPNTKSHITVNNDVCLLCQNRDCTIFCPSQVFTWSNIDEKLTVAYESCMECGACKMGCPLENIKYEHPEAGFGYIC